MAKNRTATDLLTTSSSGPQARSKALQVALTYAILGAIWIIFSDQIVDWITDDDPSTLFAQTVKGILYVAVTSMLVYWLARRAFQHIEDKIAIVQRDETQRLLDAVLGNLGEAILVVDPSTRTITQCNTAATTVFGYSESELLGQSTQLLHVDQESQARFGAISEPELEKNNVFRCQYPLKRRDSTIIDVEITVVTLHREVGWRTGVVSIIRDISERVRAHNALEASEHRYRLLAENTVDVIWSMDPNLKVTYVNPAIFQLTGYTPEEMIGNSGDAYFDDHHLSALKRLIAEAIGKGPSSTGVLVDTEILHKNGSGVPVEINGKILFDDNGHVIGLQGSTRDISQRLMYEAQLRQAQKLEAIGTLAAGIAHEVNNPITTIKGFSELLIRDKEASDKIRSRADNINKETERVSVIIKNLLAFARIEDVQEPRAVQILEVVESTLSLFQGALRKDDIIIDVLVADALPTVLWQMQEAQQVLMNLLTNARDALNTKYPGADKNKRISIVASKFVDGEANWVRLTVEDRGPGIPESFQDRVFDPFYTTKPPGEGTGLGLWIVYGIVEKNHGRIRLESEPGEYTRFNVEFPACNDQ